MNGKIGIGLAAFTLTFAAAASASAQEYRGDVTIETRGVRAPDNAYEFSINSGYTQGFGNLAGGRSVGSVADAGFAAGLDYNFRVGPVWAIGLSGQYQEFSTNQLARDARGAAFGVNAQFHMAPYNRVDPWVSLGGGYRMLWDVPAGPGNNTLYHGFEVAKLQLGLDVRASKDVAIGPMIGGGLNYFMWRNPQGAVGNLELADKRISTTVFAGIQGRFDAGGRRVAKTTTIVAGR
jgi:hypothetical protein